MTTLNTDKTQLITFDTYGTLIDWESAITGYLKEFLAEKDTQIDPSMFYRVWYYGYALPALKGPFMTYRVLLKQTFQAALAAHRIPVSPNDGVELGDVMAAAEPFADAVDSLKQLKTKYRLATISNSQDDIICHAVEKLDNPFEIVITGETTHTYKPSPALFELVLARAGVTRDQVIHVAQSQYVDLPQSVPMGLQTVWINRQHQKLLAETPAPHVMLDNLADLPGVLNV
jgi:2-haloacid dehalogenase